MTEENEDSFCAGFGQFDLASEEPTSSNKPDPVKPRTFDDSQPGQLMLIGNWYLNPDSETKVICDELEILFKQAMYFTWKCQYREALKIYKKIYRSHDHKDGHRRELLDAMVHCSLKGNLLGPLESFFSALQTDVGTFGDQLNLWSTTVTVVEHGAPHLVAPMEHMSAIIYLCTLAECGRHWSMFDKIDTSLLPRQCNFRFGAKIRAFFMLKQEYSNFERRADSIEKITENLMEKLRDELVEDFTEQQIIDARNRICSDIVKTHKSDTSVEEAHEPPPHACKLDSMVKSGEELDIIRNHFVTKYLFLFEDNPELASKLCEPQAIALQNKPFDLGEDSDAED